MSSAPPMKNIINGVKKSTKGWSRTVRNVKRSSNEKYDQRMKIVINVVKKTTEGRSRTRDQIKIIRCTKGNHYDNQNGHKTIWSQGPIWNRFRPNYHILVRQLKIGDATGRYGKCRPSPQIRAQPPNLHLSASVSHLCIAQGGSPYLRSL